MAGPQSPRQLCNSQNLNLAPILVQPRAASRIVCDFSGFAPRLSGLTIPLKALPPIRWRFFLSSREIGGRKKGRDIGWAFPEARDAVAKQREAALKVLSHSSSRFGSKEKDGGVCDGNRR